MRNLLLCALVGAATITAHGESADYIYVPPVKSLAETSSPVNTATLDAMLDGDYPQFVIDTYAGQNSALKHANVKRELQVGAGIELDWTGTDFFGAPTQDGNTFHWRTALTSVDATALRLKVDLSHLRPNETLWIVDVEGRYPLGPYTLTDAESDGQWLPTTIGDTVVVWVSSPAKSTPDITVLMASHYYESPVTKGTNPCPLPADCITDTSLQEVSTAIGRLSITDDRGTSALCSGALINNGTTEELESYFLTADHCFQDYPGTIFASALEVIWDFRANGCNGVEPAGTDFAQLPRSVGSAFLGNSATIDGMLLKLGSVPNGTRGRAWLGWDTRTPNAGERVVCLHHPAGTAMKESIGTVSRIEVDTNFGQNQTTMSWSEGITEGGSSGAPSMFNNGQFRIFGMLSNGNFQSCRGAGERLDQYSSFRDFFVQIGGFLVDTTPPGTGRTAYVTPNTGGGGGGGGGVIRGCVVGPAKTQAAVGDLLVAGLALMTLAAWRTAGQRRGD